MKLRIGNQTAYSARSTMEPFEFALANGFTAFEWFPDRGHHGVGGWAEDELDAPTREWIRTSAESHGMTLTVHATLEFNPLRDPEHPRLDSTVAFAREIGATLVNVHLEVAEGTRRFVQAITPTIERTAAAGVQLALENTVWSGPDHFNAFFAALREEEDLPIDHVGMCLDLGHANLHGSHRNDYLGYLDAIGREVPIIHLHLHENYGDRDSHLPLFSGPSYDDPGGLVSVLERLQARDFDGCGILEQWPQPPSMLLDARDGLCRLLENLPPDPAPE